MYSCLFQMSLFHTMKAQQKHTQSPSSRHLRTIQKGSQVKGRQDRGAGDQPDSMMWPRPHSTPHSPHRGKTSPSTWGLCPEASDSKELALPSATKCIFFNIINSPGRQGASVVFIHLCWEERSHVRESSLRAQSVHHEGQESLKSLTDTQGRASHCRQHQPSCPLTGGDHKNVTRALFELGTEHAPC